MNALRKTRALIRHAVQKERYDIILIALLASYLCASIGADFVAVIVGSTAMLLTAGVLIESESLRIKPGLIWSTLAVALLVITVERTVRGEQDAVVAHVLSAILAFGSAGVVMLRVLTRRHTNLTSIAAALVVYLVVGIGFANLYQAMDRLASDPFLVGGDQLTSESATYFSFVTLTTLGFGDLTPAADGARSIVTLEAIFGQFYLAIAVARMVSAMQTSDFEQIELEIEELEEGLANPATDEQS